MMRFEKVKKEIRRIARIKNAQKCQDAVKELNYNVNEKKKIKRVHRGNYHYFYEVLGYDSRGHENLGPQLGNISDSDYQIHDDEIEALRKLGKTKELEYYFGTSDRYYNEAPSELWDGLTNNSIPEDFIKKSEFVGLDLSIEFLVKTLRIQFPEVDFSQKELTTITRKFTEYLNFVKKDLNL